MVIAEVINSLTHKGGAESFFEHLCVELSKNNNVALHVVVLYDEIEESFLHFSHDKNIYFFTALFLRAITIDCITRKIHSIPAIVMPVHHA